MLAPLVAIPVLVGSPDADGVLTLAAVSLLGYPHYLSTFTFFFWAEGRATHRRQWVLYFGVPILIAVSVYSAALFHLPYIVQVVVYVWNTVHVARQSCGILSIYRQRAGLTDPALKSVANRAIMWTSSALAFWNIDNYATMQRFMVLLWTGLPRAVTWVTAAAAAVSLAGLAISMWRRMRGPSPPRVPELAFLATSLLLFHPYLWIADANRATFGTLLGHFVQYLALVWLVHRRRTVTRGTMSSPSWLTLLSASLPTLLLTSAGVGALFFALQLLSRGRPGQEFLQAALLSLALVHFYLDGLFWAFKRPEVRQQLGPFLTGMRSPAEQAAPAVG